MAALHPSPPFDELTYYPTARWIRARSVSNRVEGLGTHNIKWPS